jgi:hypothetical protein
MLKSPKAIYYKWYNIVAAQRKDADNAAVFMNQLVSNSLF